MNVVMIGPFGLAPKGTMRARALPAARALARRGHRVTVIMPPWHTPEAAGREWDDDVPGVHLEYIALDGLGLPLVGHVVVATRLARRALDQQPDVVHAFKPKAYSGLAAVVLRARQRLGASFSLVMDTDDWEGPGGWNDLEPYHSLQRRVFAWQERWGLRHTDAVTVASRALETLVWALGIPPERVTYLPNAIEPGLATAAPVDPTPADRAGQPPTIMLYTRFFEFKLGRPLAVLARVRQDWPEARLMVIGRGLFGEEKQFLALAEAQGLAEAVDYRGWVEPGDLPSLMALTDVAIYPFDDTLINRTKSPVKLLELMSAGVPIVAEAVGQNREVIEDGRSGFLVPPGDIDAWSSAIGSLLADGDRRRAIGAAARERIRTQFAWDRQVTTLEAVYAGVQARRTGGPISGSRR